MKVFRKAALLLTIVSSMLLAGCSGENYRTIRLILFGNVTTLDGLRVEILGTRALVQGNGSEYWITLQTKQDIYELNDLEANGVLLASENKLSELEVKQVQFSVGNNNTVIVNGKEYPLSLGKLSGLTLPVSLKLTDEISDINLYFDGDASVIKTPDNKYILEPVIKEK